MNKIFLVLVLASLSCFSKSLNIKDFGSIGNGIEDDWFAIQKAVNFAFDKKYDTLLFPAGKYFISKTIVISGSNLVLKGDESGLSLLEKRGNPGWWGDLIFICGKLPGHKYFGENNIEYIYKGNKEYSFNIKLLNLNLKNSSEYDEIINNIGIVNSKDIRIENCSFLESANSNLAIVNDLSRYDNINISILNCSFSNARAHNLRVLSMNKGNYSTNSVRVLNSSFYNTGITINKELSVDKIHIWYRGGNSKDGSLLEIKDCYFDRSGIVHSSGNSNGLSVTNSFLEKGYIISNNAKFYPESKVFLENVKTGYNAIKKIKGINAK